MQVLVIAGLGQLIVAVAVREQADLHPRLPDNGQSSALRRRAVKQPEHS